MLWAEKQGVRLQYIQPGNPQQNAYIGRYNRTVRPSQRCQHRLPGNGRMAGADHLWNDRGGTRTGHRMALDIHQRETQHGHWRDHSSNETENGRVVLQADPIRNGGITIPLHHAPMQGCRNQSPRLVPMRPFQHLTKTHTCAHCAAIGNRGSERTFTAQSTNACKGPF